MALQELHCKNTLKQYDVENIQLKYYQVFSAENKKLLMCAISQSKLFYLAAHN